MTPTRRGVIAAAGLAAATAAVTHASPARAEEPAGFPLRLPEMPLHDPYMVADEPPGSITSTPPTWRR